MASNIEGVNKKLQLDISTKMGLLEDYPEQFRIPFENALNTNLLELSFSLLELRVSKLTDSELISFVIPFLNSHFNIKTLKVNNNLIGVEGAKALAQNQTLTNLDVGYNQISDEGAKALAQNHTLTTLNVSRNQIGVEGAKALAENYTLTTLNVSYNQIGNEGRRALQTALEHRQKEYQQQKIAFAMGTHPRLGEASPILLFSKSCDRNLMREIFSYVKPRPFTLKFKTYYE